MSGSLIRNKKSRVKLFTLNSKTIYFYQQITSLVLLMFSEIPRS